jgi:DNA repair protein RAD5
MKHRFTGYLGIIEIFIVAQTTIAWFIDLIEIVLRREGFAFGRFDGTMSIKKKNEAVEEFCAPSRRPKIFIVSLKAGGVGLNLTTANHVFMVRK